MHSLFRRILQSFGFGSSPNAKIPNARVLDRDAGPASQPAAAKHQPEKETVFHMVLRRANHLLPPTPDNVLIVASAYTWTEPDGTVRYGNKMNAGAKSEDAFEANVAVHWHCYLREGKCTREQAVVWLRDTGRTMGEDLLHDSRFPGQDVGDERLFPALTQTTMQLFLGCFASVTLPDSVKNDLLKRLKDESGDRHLYDEMVKGRRLVRAWQRGVIDREFLELVREAAHFVPVIPETAADNPPLSFVREAPE
jgi:hypothetical protein